MCIGQNERCSFHTNIWTTACHNNVWNMITWSCDSVCMRRREGLEASALCSCAISHFLSDNFRMLALQILLVMMQLSKCNLKDSFFMQPSGKVLLNLIQTIVHSWSLSKPSQLTFCSLPHRDFFSKSARGSGKNACSISDGKTICSIAGGDKVKTRLQHNLWTQIIPIWWIWHTFPLKKKLFSLINQASN